MRSRFSETLTLKIRLPIEDTQCQPLAYIPHIPMATSAPSPTCLYMFLHALTSTYMHVYPHTCTHTHKNKNENKGHLVGLCEGLWARSLLGSYLGPLLLPCYLQQHDNKVIRPVSAAMLWNWWVACACILWSTGTPTPSSPLPSENINLLLRKWLTKQVYKKARVLQ